MADTTVSELRHRAARASRDPLWARRIAVTLAALLVLGITASRTLNGQVSESELTAISIAIALVFGLITALQNALGDRRRTTVELLGAFSTADALAASDATVARRLATGEPIGAEVDAEFDRSLIHILDYYEYLCRAARSGAVDRTMLKNLRGPSVALLFDQAQDYVADRRAKFGPELYCMTEWFVNDYCRPVFASAPADRPATA